MKMKLLIVTNNTHRASFKQRIGVYLDVLRANDIDCEIAKLPSSPIARRKLFKQAADFDGVFLHKKGLNFIDAYWLRKYGKKIIFNFDDAIMFSDKHPDKYSRSHFVPFKRTVTLADLVIVGSSYLAQKAQSFNANVKILPLGLNVNEYLVKCPPKSDDKIRLVWIGSASTLAYLEQIKPVLEEIGSRYDNVVLRIIGDDFFDITNMKVEKQRWSKERRAIDLAACDVGLAPLPDNRFTKGKCSFKVLEYASAGLPVIASPVGTNSDYVRASVTGFFATSIKEWVTRITQLIESPQLRKKMGQAGHAFAQKFDVSVIGEQLTELIKKCLLKPIVSKQ